MSTMVDSRDCATSRSDHQRLSFTQRPVPGNSIFRPRPSVPPSVPALPSSIRRSRQHPTRHETYSREPLFRGGSSNSSSSCQSATINRYSQPSQQRLTVSHQLRYPSQQYSHSRGLYNSIREPPGDSSRCSEFSTSSIEDFDPGAIAALESVLEEYRDPPPEEAILSLSRSGSGGGDRSLSAYQCQILDVPSRRNQEMVELSLLRLANLAYRNDDSQRNQRDVCADGGHMDILSVMSQYPHNREIQEEAIGALANLAAYSPEAQSIIGNDRGIEHILVAMRAHPADAKLQDDGCCVLWILVDSNLANALRLKRGEGMKVVVQAMVSHCENDCLVQDACSLIENYCQLDPHLKRDVYKALGVTALASVAENFRMDDETRRAACSALHRLTSPD